MATDPLTTSDAARVMGCSRQHVVNLCTSGQLPYTSMGTHRRIRRADVDAFVRSGGGRLLRPEQRRSLWIGRAMAGKVARDPARVLTLGRENLQRLRLVHCRSGPWLDAWAAILDSPDEVMAVLTGIDERSVELRANGPFGGLLGDEELRDVVEAARSTGRAGT
jgi:excisionase family DNA binding protein